MVKVQIMNGFEREKSIALGKTLAIFGGISALFFLRGLWVVGIFFAFMGLMALSKEGK